MPLPPPVTQAIRFPFEVIDTSMDLWIRTSIFASRQRASLLFRERLRTIPALSSSDGRSLSAATISYHPYLQVWTASNHFAMFFTVSP
jgi:hypothetical protein